MTGMPTAGREEIPIFEALQSASNTLIMPPSHHQVQQQKQSHASQQLQQEQERQQSAQLPLKAATDGGMDAAARNSGTENPTIVVGMLVQCGECGKKFINSHYLDKHINKRHRGDARQSGIARFDTSHFSTLGQTGFQQPFETFRAIVSAPLSMFEQQQQQQLKQQQQLLQQQQSLQQQQHLLQQQLSMLSAAALRANETPLPVTAISHPAPVVSATGAVPFGEVGSTLAAAAGTKNSAIPTPEDKQQTVAEVKQDVQKEIQKAVKTLRDTFKDELSELQQQLNSIEAPQHRDTALMLLNEIKSPSLRNTKKNRTRKAEDAAFSHTTGQKHSKPTRQCHTPSPISSSRSESGESSGTSSSRSYSFTGNDYVRNGKPHRTQPSCSIGRDNERIQGNKRGRHNASAKEGFYSGRSVAKQGPRTNRHSSTKPFNELEQICSSTRLEGVANEDGAVTNELRGHQNNAEIRSVDMPQTSAATGPEAAKEMRRAILCLLMYSHREFMARSQLPDVLRHNNKPPPDEAEKQLELPPGTLSCQLANYLLHPAVAGQRSGVTTSNAPQNSDSLNLTWPTPHGTGGCCYHLHKPPPPPRAFSVRAKFQQFLQRFSTKPANGPITCPAAQQQASVANGPLQSPRQRWLPPNGVPPAQLPVRNMANNPLVRLNGAQLLMQHGGQAGSVALPPAGVQKHPQQILPYTIDGGAVQTPARSLPIVTNTSGTRPLGPVPIRNQFPESSAGAAQRQPPPPTHFESNSGGREKSKSITEREVGTVLPALAWGGDEAIPSEEDLALPEPKSPFYPPRGTEGGSKLGPAFPPCSSWTPIEPPQTATSVPLSVFHAALAASGAAHPPQVSSIGDRQVSLQAPLQQTNNRSLPVKQQQQQQQQQLLGQYTGPHPFGGNAGDNRRQSAPQSEEPSVILLRAPENAFGIFGGSTASAPNQGQGGRTGNAEYLPSARGSRTLPEDAGWTEAPYQTENDLGPWQFAGLM